MRSAPPGLSAGDAGVLFGGSRAQGARVGSPCPESNRNLPTYKAGARPFELRGRPLRFGRGVAATTSSLARRSARGAFHFLSRCRVIDPSSRSRVPPGRRRLNLCLRSIFARGELLVRLATACGRQSPCPGLNRILPSTKRVLVQSSYAGKCLRCSASSSRRERGRGRRRQVKDCVRPSDEAGSFQTRSQNERLYQLGYRAVCRPWAGRTGGCGWRELDSNQHFYCVYDLIEWTNAAPTGGIEPPRTRQGCPSLQRRAEMFSCPSEEAVFDCSLTVSCLPVGHAGSVASGRYLFGSNRDSSRPFLLVS